MVSHVDQIIQKLMSLSLNAKILLRNCCEIVKTAMKIFKKLTTDKKESWQIFFENFEFFHLIKYQFFDTAFPLFRNFRIFLIFTRLSAGVMGPYKLYNGLLLWHLVSFEFHLSYSQANACVCLVIKIMNTKCFTFYHNIPNCSTKYYYNQL